MGRPVKTALGGLSLRVISLDSEMEMVGIPAASMMRWISPTD